MKHLPIALLAFGLTAGGSRYSRSASRPARLGTAARRPGGGPRNRGAHSGHRMPAKAGTAAANPCAADNLSPHREPWPRSRSTRPAALSETLPPF